MVLYFYLNIFFFPEDGIDQEDFEEVLKMYITPVIYTIHICLWPCCYGAIL